MYFGTGDGRVVARDRATGGVRWSAVVAPGEAVRGANLVVRAGVVVVPVVFATVDLDAATGRPVAVMEVKPVGDAVETASATDGRGQIFVGVTRAALSVDEP